MKKFILLFLGILVFDILYSLVYNQFLIDIKPDFLKYPFIVLNFLVSSPAIFVDRNFPFYAPVPVYLAILILIVNVLLQSLLIYTIFFKKKRSDAGLS